jgi:hypothetical protein
MRLDLENGLCVSRCVSDENHRIEGTGDRIDHPMHIYACAAESRFASLSVSTRSSNLTPDPPNMSSDLQHQPIPRT